MFLLLADQRRTRQDPCAYRPHWPSPTSPPPPPRPNSTQLTTATPNPQNDNRPHPPSKFASALTSLPLSTLQLKVLELRNSIAHLDYSNEQLQPFASPSSTSADAPAPDPICVEAIAENRVVIARMQERLGLVRAEVEKRGVEWVHFSSGEVEEEGERDKGEGTTGLSSAWTDGTFQTGVISGGR
ncbi:hypothetical protein B0T18DRAFT_424414 [Schizothecium vesticola]|uniref:Uncharacterized protein n=1 Tax=Schizothecium vesticola TaxID=314040 RepID=A0AA40FA00_9PEZI|nr:hypothetical protein B0T18DRAFT_424414 [Schizothecium vesticola]